jgi:alkylated DNA repair dioxygenase AlkB
MESANKPLFMFEGSAIEQLPIADADVSLYQQVDLGQSYDDLLHELINDTVWRQEEITLYGKTHRQPRLTAWYGGKDLNYCYSGISMQPRPWSQTLLKLKARIESLVAQGFNSVLLNYYRDHRDGMGMHSDDESELGRRPVIASLSLGEERTLLLRHKYRKELVTFKLPLPSGSLLVMKGDTQRFWKHGIMKQKQRCGPRVNLTFRTIIEKQ